MRSPTSGKLTPAQALVLGALHGPAELLPISSSGHISAIPWLLGWDYPALDEELRKSFEVALHAGTAVAMLISLRGEVEEALQRLDRRRLSVIALSTLPPAVVGYTLEDQIERRLGTPATVAAGLAGGAVAMALADRSPQARRHGQAGPRDALWLGVAQASALAPGISRNGAALTAARLLRFTRADAGHLSRLLALPVVAGATALKGRRLLQRGLEPGSGPLLAAGAGASLASTLLLTPLISQL